MIFTAAILDAETARERGLVLDVVPDADLCDLCVGVASKICSTSRSAVAEAKRVLIGGWGLPPAAANAMAQGSFSALVGTDDQRTRMAAFVAKQDRAGVES
jgi:enoyl-CoA hydratase